MNNSWKENFTKNIGCYRASIITLIAVLIVAVLTLAANTRVIIIDDGGTPCVGGVCYEATFYYSEEPFEDAISLSKLKKIGTGTIYQKVSGKKLISDVEAIVATEPDLTGIVDDNHTICWNYVYGVGKTRAVLGYVVEKETEQMEVVADDVKDASFANVSELKAATVTAGSTVKTRGFYSENDGGAADYTISDSSANAYPASIALDNGLYANLVYSGSVSVKKLGAYGDGSHSDYDAFVSAISLSNGNIYVPNGNYNISGKVISVGSNLTITGESTDGTVIKSAGFIAPYGVYVEKVTFDGAAEQKIQTTGARNAVYTLLFDVTPANTTTVTYKNCKFKNLQFGSFARENKGGTFTQETVEGCTFSNIGRVGIYHSLNSGTVTVTGNTFENIGGTDISTGHVSAVYIGDITNNTYVEAQNVIIQNNTFNNLFTQDDLSNASHEMNANFISIKSDKATISGNYIANLTGYGSDREAIYTKVRDLTVTGNTIINGGYGEGYICNKSHEGDAFYNISGNTLSGSYGSGIRVYCAGTISNNIIEISNCTAAITVTTRSDLTAIRTIDINSNRISIATSDTYVISGVAVASDTSNKAVRISNVTFPISITGNTITSNSALSQIISCSNVGSYVDVSGNSINTNGNAGVPINVSNNADSSALAASCSLNVNNNAVTVQAGQKAVSVKFTQADELVSTRLMTFTGNSFTFVGDGTRGTALSYASGPANADTVNVSGNISNYEVGKTIVSCVAAACNYEEGSFATYKINQ